MNASQRWGDWFELSFPIRQQWKLIHSCLKTPDSNLKQSTDTHGMHKNSFHAPAILPVFETAIRNSPPVLLSYARTFSCYPWSYFISVQSSLSHTSPFHLLPSVSGASHGFPSCLAQPAYHRSTCIPSTNLTCSSLWQSPPLSSPMSAMAAPMCPNSPLCNVFLLSYTSFKSNKLFCCYSQYKTPSGIAFAPFSTVK